MLAAVLLTGCGGPAAVAPPSGAPTAQLRIGMSEYRFTLSAAAVRPGAVEVRVTNAGSARHDVQLVQDGAVLGASAVLPPGGTETLRLQVPATTSEISLRCTVAGHAEAGMTGSLAVVP